MAFKSSKVQAFKVFGLVSVLTFELLNPLNLERVLPRRRSIKARPFESLSARPPAAVTISGRGSWPAITASTFPAIRRSWCKICPAPRPSSLRIIFTTSPSRTGSLSARSSRRFISINWSAGRKLNSISPRSAGSDLRNRTTSSIICAPICPIEVSTISARPKSRPAAVVLEPAQPDFTFRAYSTKFWARNIPSSAVTPAVGSRLGRRARRGPLLVTVGRYFLRAGALHFLAKKRLCPRAAPDQP